MSLYKAPKFLFKCTSCDYHATIKGLWAVIIRYPDTQRYMYSFICVTCDAKKGMDEDELRDAMREQEQHDEDGIGGEF